MKRGLMNPNRATGTNKEQIATEVHKKFEAWKTKILQEKSIEKIIPLDSTRKKIIANMMGQKRLNDFKSEWIEVLLDADDEQESKNVRLRELVKHDARVAYDKAIESADTAAEERFFKDFFLWLLGQGEEAHHQRTPWYRKAPALELPEVREFFKGFINMFFDTWLFMIKLAFYGPQNMHEYFIYFKFLVHPEDWPVEDEFYFVWMAGPNGPRGYDRETKMFRDYYNENLEDKLPKRAVRLIDGKRVGDKDHGRYLEDIPTSTMLFHTAAVAGAPIPEDEEDDVATIKKTYQQEQQVRLQIDVTDDQIRDALTAGNRAEVDRLMAEQQVLYDTLRELHSELAAIPETVHRQIKEESEKRRQEQEAAKEQQQQREAELETAREQRAAELRKQHEEQVAVLTKQLDEQMRTIERIQNETPEQLRKAVAANRAAMDEARADQLKRFVEMQRAQVQERQEMEAQIRALANNSEVKQLRDQINQLSVELMVAKQEERGERLAELKDLKKEQDRALKELVGKIAAEQHFLVSQQKQEFEMMVKHSQTIAASMSEVAKNAEEGAKRLNKEQAVVATQMAKLSKQREQLADDKVKQAKAEAEYAETRRHYEELKQKEKEFVKEMENARKAQQEMEERMAKMKSDHKIGLEQAKAQSEIEIEKLKATQELRVKTLKGEYIMEQRKTKAAAELEQEKKDFEAKAREAQLKQQHQTETTLQTIKHAAETAETKRGAAYAATETALKHRAEMEKKEGEYKLKEESEKLRLDKTVEDRINEILSRRGENETYEGMDVDEEFMTAEERFQREAYENDKELVNLEQKRSKVQDRMQNRIRTKEQTLKDEQKLAALDVQIRDARAERASAEIDRQSQRQVWKERKKLEAQETTGKTLADIRAEGREKKALLRIEGKKRTPAEERLAKLQEEEKARKKEEKTKSEAERAEAEKKRDEKKANKAAKKLADKLAKLEEETIAEREDEEKSRKKIEKIAKKTGHTIAEIKAKVEAEQEKAAASTEASGVTHELKKEKLVTTTEQKLELEKGKAKAAELTAAAKAESRRGKAAQKLRLLEESSATKIRTAQDAADLQTRTAEELAEIDRQLGVKKGEIASGKKARTEERRKISEENRAFAKAKMKEKQKERVADRIAHSEDMKAINKEWEDYQKREKDAREVKKKAEAALKVANETDREEKERLRDIAKANARVHKNEAKLAEHKKKLQDNLEHERAILEAELDAKKAAGDNLELKSAITQAALENRRKLAENRVKEAQELKKINERLEEAKRLAREARTRPAPPAPAPKRPPSLFEPLPGGEVNPAGPSRQDVEMEEPTFEPPPVQIAPPTALPEPPATVPPAPSAATPPVTVPLPTPPPALPAPKLSPATLAQQLTTPSPKFAPTSTRGPAPLLNLPPPSKQGEAMESLLSSLAIINKSIAEAYGHPSKRSRSGKTLEELESMKETLGQQLGALMGAPPVPSAPTTPAQPETPPELKGAFAKEAVKYKPQKPTTPVFKEGLFRPAEKSMATEFRSEPAPQARKPKTVQFEVPELKPETTPQKTGVKRPQENATPSDVKQLAAFLQQHDPFEKDPLYAKQWRKYRKMQREMSDTGAKGAKVKRKRAKSPGGKIKIK